MSKRVFLTNLSDFPGNRATFTVEGHPLLVVRQEENFYALVNKCPHLGLPLTNGKVEGDAITCPFHNSRFDLKSGENLDWVTGLAGAKLPEWSRRLLAMGKKPAPLHVFAVAVEDGKLYIEI
ncbi:MAG: Rieske (2Fe-2S) protein [Candidatus Villigracilaceae bacterium]